ncbi:hypothetical protein QBC35DRAFT_514129 [Podospora australis]|uniref:F-box domain-containing protein n=1 Tax=Podospora australis TaxID=1536484 RepID=A0AAN6WW90_9PEZI|nr:hypothetical protein QBC35DRAFT_514129 [Podospora australis]
MPSAMKQTGLTALPDEILLLVIANFESARDLFSLSLTSKTLYRLVSEDGWRLFVKNRFPSLSVPPPTSGPHTWNQLAESLTWQSRCWDRRALQFQALLPWRRQQHQRAHHRAESNLFHTVVDAHFDLTTQEELVVWGAGEDIVARYRQRNGDARLSNSSWHRVRGKELGFEAGHDDVKAIKVVQHQSGRAIVTGRHNGQLSLLSAEPSRFGEHITDFNLASQSLADGQQALEQNTVNSVDVLHKDTTSLIAAATKNTLSIFRLGEDDDPESDPSMTYDLREEVFSSSSSRLSRAKWMGSDDLIALALGGSRDPLRYLILTPTGWTHQTAAKNLDIMSRFDLKADGNLCPNSIEPVYRNGTGKTSLLLSAWRDGTCRLQDLRTSSPFDTVYQDNIDPWVDAEALMTYGGERFVAGGGDGLTIKIFDFRWTKGYYHTSGLSCLDRVPFPAPSQAFLKPPTSDLVGQKKCDHLTGQHCHWHKFSKDIYYRPNYKYFLTRSLSPHAQNASVWSFARGSDISPHFYVGISGGVIEANLEPCPNSYPPDHPTVDNNFGFQNWRARAADGSGYVSRVISPTLMEIGDGYAYKHNDRSIRLPRLWKCGGPQGWTGDQLQASKHHRLDVNYQLRGDLNM